MAIFFDSPADAPRRARPWRSLWATAVAAVLVVAVPLLVMLGWSGAQLRQAARQDVAATAQTMAEVAAGQHNRLLADTRGFLAGVSHLPQLLAAPATCGALVSRLLAQRPGYTNLGVIGLDGRVLCSALPFDPGLILGDRSYFRRAVETGDFAVGDYQVGRITGVPGINFGYPVRAADGRTQAVVFAAIGATWLPSLMDAGALPAGSTVKLFDHRLQLLARDPVATSATDESRLRANVAELAEAIATRPAGGVYFDSGLDGKPRIYAYTRLGTQMQQHAPYLVIGLPPSALQTRLERMVSWQAGGVAGALALALALAVGMVHHRVLDPARQLAVAATRLAGGERGVRLRARHTVDEFAIMADAFNHMAARTDASIRALTVLSAGNHALLRGQTEQQLLDEMCRVAVQVGGYRHAWVAYVADDGIRKMAEAGDDSGFAGYLQAHWGTALSHQTPTARAIATGEPVVLDDASVGAEHDLFQAAASRGLRAGLVLPLRVDGTVIGALTIYAPEARAFAPREVTLLAEMAEDLSFGIATARLRERHRQVDARLRHLAYFDGVTGLSNRASFVEHITATQADTDSTLAVLVVDLHNYWQIEATLGSLAGEEFLRAVAARLQAHAPALLARVAQSEFALLLSGQDEAGACHYANRVLASLEQAAALSLVSADIDATVGIALGGRRRGDGERMLQAAKLAAREASTGALRLLLARPELEREWSDRLILAADLRAAIDERQLRVHVQPQLDLRSGRICGMEALARWQHPVRGEMSPARFIGLAEQTGLIRPLTYAILETVCELAGRHAAAGLLLPVAVNVSTRNLYDPEFVGRVTELLERWPLPRACLHPELTETAVMDDPARSLKVLQQLHALGLPIYMDDFGTGYSSMTYLRELPLSGLKIDRAFTIGLAQPDTRRIVQAMIDLGHALGLKVVAEGTEDETTLGMLTDMGCDIAQGYGIARPMPNADMAGWIERWPGRPINQAPISKG